MDMLLYEKTGYYETLRLEIFGGYYTLEDIYIHQKINEHTIMRLTAVVSEESAMIYEQELLSNRGLRLVQKQGEEELVLFGGMIQNLIVERKNGIYYIHIEGASFTKYIDVRKENVSYQNENSTYEDVIDKALEKYDFSGIPYLWTEKSRSNTVNRFLLQFKETDWEFIKRVASIEHLGLIPDMTGRHTQFFIGLPKGREEKAVPPCKHTVQRHLQKAEKEVRNGSVGKDIYPGDYLQYILHDITAHYELGDAVRFQDVSYIVVEKTSILKKEDGILWNTYVVQQKKGISFPRLYNNALRGNSLTGTVIDVKRNFTKLHLHIDKQQQEVATACWFPQPQYFTAGSDSGFCIMPERGDMMRLHFPTKDEAEHYIICSDNGDFDKLLSSINASKGGKEPEKATKASNSNAPYEKYLTTPEGKGMLFNDSVVKYHTTGDISTIQMEDGKGITISSEGNIEMLANNIVLFATEQVRMTAGKKIELISGGSSIIIDGEDNRIDEKAGDIYLESPLNEETPVLTEDGGSLLLSEWGYERENMEFSLSGEVYKLELVKAFRDQWKETSGEYTPEGDMPPLYQANKKNPKSINDINFKNWLWREYNIKLEDIILLESQLNENLALALRHQNKIGITHTSDGIRITEKNKCDPVIQKEIYEDWKKNSGQYDPKNDVIPEWEMDALHPRTVNDIKFEQYLLREYGMTRKEEIEKTFGGNIDALLKMSTIFDVFTLGTAAVAKLTGKKVWKEVGEEVGEKIFLKEGGKEFSEKVIKVTNPLDDPKIAKDVIADSNAVYGYRPKPGSSLDQFDIDWSNLDEVAKARVARLKYLEAMKVKRANLSTEVETYLQAGKSMAEIAEIKVNQRNIDRIKSYIERNDYKNLKKLYDRNLKEYGRTEGPTVEQLLEKYGSYEEIIYSSVKVNEGMNMILGIEH